MSTTPPSPTRGLYHSLKAAHHPGRLLMAPLADDPKFKGMADGALKTLRLQTKRQTNTTSRTKKSIRGRNSHQVAKVPLGP